MEPSVSVWIKDCLWGQHGLFYGEKDPTAVMGVGFLQDTGYFQWLFRPSFSLMVHQGSP